MQHSSDKFLITKYGYCGPSVLQCIIVIDGKLTLTEGWPHSECQMRNIYYTFQFGILGVKRKKVT